MHRRLFGKAAASRSKRTPLAFAEEGWARSSSIYKELEEEGLIKAAHRETDRWKDRGGEQGGEGGEDEYLDSAGGPAERGGEREGLSYYLQWYAHREAEGGRGKGLRQIDETGESGEEGEEEQGGEGEEEETAEAAEVGEQEEEQEIERAEVEEEEQEGGGEQYVEYEGGVEDYYEEEREEGYVEEEREEGYVEEETAGGEVDAIEYEYDYKEGEAEGGEEEEEEQARGEYAEGGVEGEYGEYEEEYSYAYGEGEGEEEEEEEYADKAEEEELEGATEEGEEEAEEGRGEEEGQYEERDIEGGGRESRIEEEEEEEEELRPPSSLQSPEIEGESNTEVRYVEGKGRCLFTTIEVNAGDIILTEKPLLVVTPQLDPKLWVYLQTLHKDKPFSLPPIWHMAAISSFQLLSNHQLKLCLDKWTPDQEPEEGESESGSTLSEVRRVLKYLSARRREGEYEGREIGERMYSRLLLVWRYNSFGHHSESEGLVLYNRISMIAHSCLASGCWEYGREEDCFILRARVHLKEGEEITISYISDEDLIKCTSLRRERLEGWLFKCNCIRCILPSDSARGFRCSACGSGSMFFKTDDDVTTAEACTLCGTTANEEVIEKYITFEKAYADRLTETNKEDMKDAEMVYEQATRVFTQHWILYQLDTILFEGYGAAGDYESAYIHQMHRVSYVTAVLPLASYTLAWLYEEMGDVLWGRIQAKGKPYAESSLRIAGRHFEDAYNILYILCGADHNYTNAAAAKRNRIDQLSSDV